MISIQQPYVEYIKIPTTDANGLDLTPTLLALTQIKIPFSNGVSVTYFIESTTNFSSYFLFGIVKASNSPFQSDGGNLNYDYTSSLSQTAVSGIKIPPNGVNNPIPLTGVPTDIFGIDNTNLIFQTYTQKDVTIGVSFTASISGGPLEAKLLKNGFAISGVSGVALNVGTTKGIISATFTSSSLSPGDNFQFNMQAPTAGGAYEFTGSLLGKSHFFASSNLFASHKTATLFFFPEPLGKFTTVLKLKSPPFDCFKFILKDISIDSSNFVVEFFLTNSNISFAAIFLSLTAVFIICLYLFDLFFIAILLLQYPLI